MTARTLAAYYAGQAVTERAVVFPEEVSADAVAVEAEVVRDLGDVAAKSGEHKLGFESVHCFDAVVASINSVR